MATVSFGRVAGLEILFDESTSADFDDDGITDAFENANQLDPLNPDDSSLDPDNDGLDNLGEFNAGTDPHDPDFDSDGIRDGLDASPTVHTNVCDPDAGAPEEFSGGDITTVVQCAGPEGIIVKSATHVMGTGDLQVITPKTTGFESGFRVAGGGKLSVNLEELPAP